MGLKHPGNIYFPFVERLGLLLLKFLNANLSTYETAYKDFFYAYGFELLKDLDKNYKFELKGKYGDDETYLKETKKIYNNLKNQLLYVQENIKDAVNYIYNINENEDLKPFTHSQRYAVYLIKRKGKLYSYIKNVKTVVCILYLIQGLMKFTAIIQKKMEKLVGSKEQYFLIIEGYKKNLLMQNIEKHINKNSLWLIKIKMIKI